MLILFEGPEGAGKTTHALRLERELQELGVRVKYVREPGQTKVGLGIRHLLLDPENKGMVPLSEYFLFLAARAQLLEEIVRPELQVGGTVIMDRYSLSTMAYQIGARGLPMAPALASLEFATGGLVPDLTVLLMTSYEVGMARVGRRGKGKDRLEAEEEQFHRRVIAGYRAFADILPAWNIRTIETDGLMPDDVYERIEALLRAEHSVYE